MSIMARLGALCKGHHGNPRKFLLLLVLFLVLETPRPKNRGRGRERGRGGRCFVWCCPGVVPDATFPSCTATLRYRFTHSRLRPNRSLSNESLLESVRSPP